MDWGSGNREHTQSGGSSDKWEERTKTGSPGTVGPNQMCHCSQCPIKIMDDARPRQMEIIEMIFSNHNIMVYIFVQGFIWNILICQLSALRVCCDFSLWWLIRLCPPSLHTSLFALVNAGPRFPRLPRIPQFTKCLSISTSSGPHSQSPLSPPWQLLLQEASIITPQFPQ